MQQTQKIRQICLWPENSAEKSNCSYIFGDSSFEIFNKKYDNNFACCAEVITALFRFALKDLFVIRNEHSGVISANFVLPMAFKLEKEKVGMKGDFAVPLDQPVVLTPNGSRCWRRL